MFNFDVINPGQPLSDPERVLKSAQTLLRTHHVSSQVPTIPRMRANILGPLRGIAEAPSASLDEMKGRLTKIKKTLLDLYSPFFDQCVDVQDIQKVIRRMLKDAEASKLSVIQKSSHGFKGPTLLIDVPRIKMNEENQPKIDSWHRAVVKWTNWSEIASSRLYAFFSQSFTVPQGIAIDFDTMQIVSVLQGQSQSIDEKTCEQMQQCFALIKKRFPTEDNSGTKIMVSEKIVGENFFDFATSKYEQLSQLQKERVFSVLAKMAVLDLVLGNFDRFASINWNEETSQYIFEAFEANLGNAMVKWGGDSSQDPQVFAIDNEIEVIEHEEQYHEFLQKLFTDSDVREKMAENMVQNFEYALKNHSDDLHGKNIEEKTAKLGIFADEARSLGKAVFIEGIQKAFAELPDQISKWNSSEGDSLREYLHNYSPHFEMIQKRIRGFERPQKETKAEGL